jgi:hypothetical protein
MKPTALIKPILRTVLFLLIISTVFISCKKNNTAPTPVAVTSCFDGVNNGIYTGNGTVSSTTPFVNTPVTITKLSCTSLKIESSAFSTITVNSLTASSPGNYAGTTTAGHSLSISFPGNTVSIGGVELSFNGTK